MADRPDPDKPGLPPLRRFRLDPDGGGGPQEVTSQSGDAKTASGAGTGAPGTPNDPAYAGPDGDETELLSPDDAKDDYSFEDPDTLLRETDETLDQRGEWTPTADPAASPGTSPAPAADATTRMPAASGHEPGQGMSGATAPVGQTPPPAAERGTNGWAATPAGSEPPGPPAGPIPGAGPDGPGKKKSKMPIIIGAVVAVVLIALLLWFFVFNSSDDTKNDKAPVETTTVEPSAPSDQDDEDTDESGRDEEAVPSGGSEDNDSGASEPEGSSGSDEDDGGVRTTDGNEEPTMPGASAGPTSMPDHD